MIAEPIYLAVAGKFHAFALATELAQLARLGKLFCAYHTLRPPKMVSRHQCENRWDLALWQDVGLRWPGTGFTFERKSVIFDRWLSARLAAEAPGVLHGWNGHVAQTFQDLRGTGWFRCVERSCPDNLFQHELLLEESRRIGVRYDHDPAHVRRAHQELYEADVIVAPSRYSANSYTDAALRAKVRINPLGGNFSPLPVRRRPGAPLRVLCVGNNFLRKGIHYLVEAFRSIPDRQAELWIRGEVPSAYRSRIKDSRIRVIGAVSQAALRELYQQATVFCLPSVDEGFGMVVLEALAFGLPLVVTEHVGAADLLDGRVARIVPIRQPLALAEGLREIAAINLDKFDHARREILARNSWQACARRMLDEVYVRPTAGLDSRAANQLPQFSRAE